MNINFLDDHKKIRDAFTHSFVLSWDEFQIKLRKH